MQLDSRLLACALLATLLAACSDPEASRESSEVRQVDLEEVLRLGNEAAGDTVLFSSINGLMVNSRGEIIVEELRRTSIRVLSSDGAYMNDIGGAGEGPGEYRYIGSTVVGSADSVYVWENLARRVMVYDPNDFFFVRHVVLDDESVKSFMRLKGIVEAGWIMTMGASPFQQMDDGTRTINEDTDYEIRKVDLDGSYGQEVITTLQDSEMIYYIGEGNRSFGIVGVPFGREAIWAMGPNDMFYHGWNDSIHITVTSVDGSIQGLIRHEHDPVFITAAEMEEAHDLEDELFRKLLAEREPHKTKPAFETFVVDETGNVWVKLSSIENATIADWLILDMESEVVGRAELPITVTLKVIRNGRAYGTEQQEGEDIMVVVYEIK